MTSLPLVLGLGFGAFGVGSEEVDEIIGQLAEISLHAATVPEPLRCCDGNELYVLRVEFLFLKPPMMCTRIYVLAVEKQILLKPS